MAGDITLKVIEARPTDVGRGIARVDPQVLNDMGWQAGDIVSIEGRRLRLWSGLDTLRTLAMASCAWMETPAEMLELASMTEFP